ncbi:MAG TPA: PQQ-dependent sugar dehydrogenase [Anaerolineae bacterium]|nr:PQQ-dependent sugar dehydrogenase [Anaerolineae bacterium]
MPIIAPASEQIMFEIVASGFVPPLTVITNAGDERLLVGEQRGVVHVLSADWVRQEEPFLDIRALVGNGFGQGILGLAFDPDYEQNRYVYVHYVDQKGVSRIVRFVTIEEPWQVDMSSAMDVLSIPHLDSVGSHYGGPLRFGPNDGYLYIAVGDGGFLVEGNRAQDLSLLWGKVLRLDVSGAEPYEIPIDNPYVGVDGARPEIWSLGLRNPWSMSFDGESGDLYIGDVGEEFFDEINYQEGSSEGGDNYGWRCYQGDEPYDLDKCEPDEIYRAPVYSFAHRAACNEVLVVGPVYEGVLYPERKGRLLFAEMCTGKFYWLIETVGGWLSRETGQLSIAPTVMGSDVRGEVYVGGVLSEHLYLFRR